VVIKQLSEVVKNNPDSIELYLALGNLFRSQSDLERAIHLRQTIIARPNLDPKFKARAWYELGIDYKRAGLIDRAIYALKQSKKILGNDPNILRVLATIYAQSNDFKQAVEYYEKLGDPIAQAHYLAKWSKQKQDKEKLHLLKRALHIYIGSPEAWLELLLTNWKDNKIKEFMNNLEQALSNIEKDINFTILEGIYQEFKKSSDSKLNAFIWEIHNVISTINPDILLTYYNALFLLLIGEEDKARIWLEKTLLLNTNFWPARLVLLKLDKDKQSLPENFRLHLDFFIEKASFVKKFNCRRCGLKREVIFFICPRCSSWHSIAFRKQLND